jgi:hypothetical protein
VAHPLLLLGRLQRLRDYHHQVWVPISHLQHPEVAHMDACLLHPLREGLAQKLPGRDKTVEYKNDLMYNHTQCVDCTCHYSITLRLELQPVVCHEVCHELHCASCHVRPSPLKRARPWTRCCKPSIGWYSDTKMHHTRFSPHWLATLYECPVFRCSCGSLITVASQPDSCESNQYSAGANHGQVMVAFLLTRGSKAPSCHRRKRSAESAKDHTSFEQEPSIFYPLPLSIRATITRERSRNLSTSILIRNLLHTSPSPHPQNHQPNNPHRKIGNTKNNIPLRSIPLTLLKQEEPEQAREVERETRNEQRRDQTQ